MAGRAAAYVVSSMIRNGGGKAGRGRGGGRRVGSYNTTREGRRSAVETSRDEEEHDARQTSNKGGGSLEGDVEGGDCSDRNPPRRLEIHWAPTEFEKNGEKRSEGRGGTETAKSGGRRGWLWWRDIKGIEEPARTSHEGGIKLRDTTDNHQNTTTNVTKTPTKKELVTDTSFSFNRTEGFKFHVSARLGYVSEESWTTKDTMTGTTPTNKQ